MMSDAAGWLIDAQWYRNPAEAYSPICHLTSSELPETATHFLLLGPTLDSLFFLTTVVTLMEGVISIADLIPTLRAGSPPNQARQGVIHLHI